MIDKNNPEEQRVFTVGKEARDEQLIMIDKRVEKSHEEGFRGNDPDQWFNDAEMKVNLIAPMHSNDPTDLYFDS